MTLDDACKEGKNLALKNKRDFVYIRHTNAKGYYPSIIPGKNSVYKLFLKWELEDLNNGSEKE